MNIITCMRALAVACLSCALGACAVAGPDESGVDQSTDEGKSADVSTQEGEEEVGTASEAAIACGGIQHRCLAMCSKTGSTLHVVGAQGQLTETCSNAGETFCQYYSLGYRTFTCWGHL